MPLLITVFGRGIGFEEVKENFHQDYLLPHFQYDALTSLGGFIKMKDFRNLLGI